MTIKPATDADFDEAMENEAIRAWQDLSSVTPVAVRQAVATVVMEGAETLTEEFYDRMTRGDRASRFLDQERVQKRLRASLRRWMIDLFEVDSDMPQSIRRQVEVGIVHARIRLPIDLIPAGIRILKRGIRRRIDFAPLDPADRLLALVYVSDLLHLADGLMNQAYFRDAQDVVRNDEAYRLVTQKRSTSFDRARQRAALSEWAEALLLAVWSRSSPPEFGRLRDSEFGIWLHHKGSILFGDSPDYRSLLESVNTMDNALLVHLNEAAQDRQRTDTAVTAIKQMLDLIRFKLNELFDHTGVRDDGLDVETQLPDRRYLPAILSNEMQAHQDSGRPFCVLMIEVQLPAFKAQHSSSARSRLLQVAVHTLLDCARTTELAHMLTEELRNALQTGNVQGSWKPVQSTIGVGIAEYDRHPDYQYLIQRAEMALSEASKSSRTRIAYA